MADAPAAPGPERTLLQTRSDYEHGFGRILGLVRRELRIFDPDLSELQMTRPSAWRRSRAFCAADPTAGCSSRCTTSNT